MRDAALDQSQAGITIAGRNINNLRYVDSIILTVKKKKKKKKEELKKPLDKGERGVKRLA